MNYITEHNNYIKFVLKRLLYSTIFFKISGMTMVMRFAISSAEIGKSQRSFVCRRNHGIMTYNTRRAAPEVILIKPTQRSL